MTLATMRSGRNDLRARTHPAWWAFVVHRVSGIALSLFLPFHFFALSQALQGADALASVLRWTEHPAVKAAEWLLVLALAAHTTGGIRLLQVEFVGWRSEGRKSAMAIAAGVALGCALVFAFELVNP